MLTFVPGTPTQSRSRKNAVPGSPKRVSKKKPPNSKDLPREIETELRAFAIDVPSAGWVEAESLCSGSQALRFRTHDLCWNGGQ